MCLSNSPSSKFLPLCLDNIFDPARRLGSIQPEEGPSNVVQISRSFNITVISQRRMIVLGEPFEFEGAV